ncbi:MAG: hypothetical protein GYA51_05705 [Candidatus Methanofastidiosa archaeon]|jgi:hypothetical protein|nr:hypothetical protein [Candidatus Methanofastidiosa archaeon]
MLLFQPKTKEEILESIATSDYKNREYLIYYYDNNEDTFNKIFKELQKFPQISIKGVVNTLKNHNEYGTVESKSMAVSIIKILQAMGWSDKFVITSRTFRDGRQRYVIEIQYPK